MYNIKPPLTLPLISSIRQMRVWHWLLSTSGKKKDLRKHTVVNYTLYGNTSDFPNAMSKS